MAETSGTGAPLLIKQNDVQDAAKIGMFTGKLTIECFSYHAIQSASRGCNPT